MVKLIESRMSCASIRRSDAKARKVLLSLRLAELRKSLKIDQSSVKGFTQPAVSKIEGREDIKLSTLIEYCHGLGATVEINARPRRTGARAFVVLRA